jgi:hypothetical protein
MKAILELGKQGYECWLEDNGLHYRYVGTHAPDSQQVRPLLEYLRRHKGEAVTFLQRIQAEAVALLDQIDALAPLVWCRRWADLATRAGWPCSDSRSWAEWLEKVKAEMSQVSFAIGSMHKG